MKVAFMVHGFVQGVGYRYFVKRAADALGIRGFVRNENDGSVLIVAEADEGALEKFETDIDISTEHGIQVMKIEKFGEDYSNFPKVPYDPLKFLIKK